MLIYNSRFNLFQGLVNLLGCQYHEAHRRINIENKNPLFIFLGLQIANAISWLGISVVNKNSFDEIIFAFSLFTLSLFVYFNRALNFRSYFKNFDLLQMGLLATVLGHRLFILHRNSLSHDEMAQIASISDGSPLLYATATHQQPSFGYAINAFLANSFPVSELSMRLPSLILTLLSISLFWQLGLKLGLKKYTVFFLSVLFAFNNWLVEASILGRPYSYSLLAALILLHLWFDFKAAKYSLPAKVNLGLALLYFFQSISIQPIIFASLLLATVYRKQRLQEILWMSLPALALVLLNYLFIFTQTLKYFDVFAPKVTTLNLILDTLSSFFISIPGIGQFVGLAFLILLFYAATQALPKAPIELKILTLFFPIITAFIYLYVINWYLLPRYLLVWLIPSLLILGFWMESFAYSKWLNILLVLMYFSTGNGMGLQLNRPSHWKEFYNFLSQVKEDSLVLRLSYIPIDGFDDDSFTGADIYFTPLKKKNIFLNPKKVSRYTNQTLVSTLVELIGTERQFQKIYLVENSIWSKANLQMYELNSTIKNRLSFEELNVLEIEPTSHYIQGLINFFEIAKSKSNWLDFINIKNFQSLSVLYAKVGRCDLARTHLLGAEEILKIQTFKTILSKYNIERGHLMQQQAKEFILPLCPN